MAFANFRFVPHNYQRGRNNFFGKQTELCGIFQRLTERSKAADFRIILGWCYWRPRSEVCCERFLCTDIAISTHSYFCGPLPHGFVQGAMNDVVENIQADFFGNLVEILPFKIVYDCCRPAVWRAGYGSCHFLIEQPQQPISPMN